LASDSVNRFYALNMYPGGVRAKAAMSVGGICNVSHKPLALRRENMSHLPQ